jgi:hypothetical protein
MRVLILMTAVVLPSSAIADTCLTMEGPTLINECQACVELTARALRPPAEQAAGLFTGESRTVRLEARARETLQGSERWAIIDFKPCH